MDLVIGHESLIAKFSLFFSSPNRGQNHGTYFSWFIRR
jgi:hypothetical protein